MAHEKPLERRDALDRGEAQAPREAQRRQVVREQAVQGVRDGEQRHVVDAPPALVALQRVAAADVEA